MVVGGKGHDTTEVYQDNEWRIVSGIQIHPRAMSSMEVTTFNDKILLFGKIILRDDCSLFLRLDFRWR